MNSAADMAGKTRGGQTMPDRLAMPVFLLGVVLAVSHLGNEWVQLAQPWGPVWKASGIVVLGLAAFFWRAPLVGVALLLSAAGDVLLELDGLFVAGMGAFGAAHVVYSIIFGLKLKRDGVAPMGWLAAGAVLAVSVVLMVWLRPGMGGLEIPATAYQVIITVMALLAVLSRASVLAKVGALVFMLSDTLIAIRLFQEITPPLGSVWITYIGAQIMLCWSLARAPR
jgi:uncharacterized membrane protein YhhN